MATATFDAKRAQALFDEGMSCRAIAGRMGVAPSTVSRWAKASGLSFDRSGTAAATQAHKVDLAALRLELATEMGLAAKELLASRKDSYLVYAFGGKDNTFNSEELDRPPVEVIRNIVTTAGIAFDKATKFLETNDEGEKDARSLLRDLGQALGITESTPLAD